MICANCRCSHLRAKNKDDHTTIMYSSPSSTSFFSQILTLLMFQLSYKKLPHYGCLFRLLRKINHNLFILTVLFLHCIFTIMSFLEKLHIAFYKITRFNCVHILFYQKPHIYSPFSHQDIEWDILKNFALFLGNDKFLKSILKLVVLT